MRSLRLVRGLAVLVFALAGFAGGQAVQAAEEIRIGVVSPLTGPSAKFGQAQRNALTMATEDVGCYRSSSPLQSKARRGGFFAGRAE